SYIYIYIVPTRRSSDLANYDFAKAKSAYVYKTMVDPFIGKYSFIKVCSGVIKGDDVLYNADTDAEAKPGKIYTMLGNKPIEVSEDRKSTRLNSSHVSIS